MDEKQKIRLLKYAMGIGSMIAYFVFWQMGGELLANMYLMAIVMGAYLND